jgi:hypothetical protein
MGYIRPGPAGRCIRAATRSQGCVRPSTPVTKTHRWGPGFAGLRPWAIFGSCLRQDWCARDRDRPALFKVDDWSSVGKNQLKPQLAASEAGFRITALAQDDSLVVARSDEAGSAAELGRSVTNFARFTPSLADPGLSSGSCGGARPRLPPRRSRPRRCWWRGRRHAPDCG